MARPHIEPFVELNEGYKKFRLRGFMGADFKTLSTRTTAPAPSR